MEPFSAAVFAAALGAIVASLATIVRAWLTGPRRARLVIKDEGRTINLDAANLSQQDIERLAKILAESRAPEHTAASDDTNESDRTTEPRPS